MAIRLRNMKLSKYYSNSNNKKRQYNKNVLRAEHGTITPLVISWNVRCRRCYSKLIEEKAKNWQ